MTVLDGLILGVIQGLTEFLPVSSSGHLVLFQNLLGFTEPMIAFDIVVHLGTLMAVLIYYFKDICKMISETLLMIVSIPKIRNWQVYFLEHPYALIACFVVVTTFVTGVIGITFEGVFKSFFESLAMVGVAWMIMGGILMLSWKFQNGARDLKQMNLKDALVVGLVQGLAITPGISRSGMTILGGMLCGLDKKEAARFSFFAAIAAILGAGVLEAKDGFEFARANSGVLIAGFFSAAITGYAAIVLLLKLVAKGKFFVFGIYCMFLGIFTLLYSILA